MVTANSGDELAAGGSAATVSSAAAAPRRYRESGWRPAVPRPGQIRQAQRLYADCLAFGALDQVEIASSHLTLVNAALGWPHARYRVRSGPDGADLELLDVLRRENVASRFTHVAIGSGDRLFAGAAHLAAQGVWVTVVSRRRRLSRAARPRSTRGDLHRHPGKGCLMHTPGQHAAPSRAHPHLSRYGPHRRPRRERRTQSMTTARWDNVPKPPR